MSGPDQFNGISLWGGFTLSRVELCKSPMLDALGREAIARTAIIGSRLSIMVRTGLSDREFSVTLYHEILEAMTVAVSIPPDSVIEFNEADFDRAAYEAFEKLGPATPATLNALLQSYGFREKERRG